MSHIHTIWKYALEKSPGNQAILMPKVAHIMDVQLQGDELVMWAAIHLGKEHEVEWRTFKLAGTGAYMELPEDVTLDYIKTVQLPDGYVAHVFELLKVVECDV